MAERPNLLLVVFDTARRDAFEPYGAPPGSSPTIAQLAARGGAHPAAYSTGCWTVPGHGSLFTGLLPRSAGLGHQGMTGFKDFGTVLDGLRDRVLPAVLTKAGYETAGISTNGWISKRMGFATGFERFTQLRSSRAAGVGATDPRVRARWYLQALRARADDGARRAEALLDEWVRGGGNRPFFWFVNLMECHSPYLPPRPFTPAGPAGRLLAARDARRHLTHDALWRASCGGFAVPARVRARMQDLYAGAIRQLDAWLGRVLELLDRRGLLDSTAVVALSDHGENFGEAGLMGHAFSLDDRLLRVPLVWAGPVDLSGLEPLSLAGLPRLLAGELGIDDHPWHDDVGTRGVVVAQFDAPGTVGDPRVDETIARWGLGPEAERRLCTSFTCATDGRHKLLRHGGGEEWFIDLAADPDELAARPLVAADRALGSSLSRLRAELDRAEQAERHDLAARTTTTTTVPADEEAAALEEQLRLLGYL